MMNRFSFAYIFLGLVVLSSGCTLGEVYGDKCPDWVSSGKTYEPNLDSYDVQDAKKAGYCPDGYVCTLNADKLRTCRTKCDENSFLCNDKCYVTSSYNFSIEKFNGLDYCIAMEKCSDSCKNGCNEKGACKCSEACEGNCYPDGSCKGDSCYDNCLYGCNSDGKCKCADSCKNGCNADGSCNETTCPKDCLYGCNSDGKCKCAESCKDCNADGSCNETTCPKDCQYGCDSEGKCKCSTSCKDECNPNGSCKETTCPDKCLYGCNSEGKCNCSKLCKDKCNPDGSCEGSSCPDGCSNGCDDKGRCICTDDCLFGCDDRTGNCISKCTHNVCLNNYLYNCTNGKLIGDSTQCPFGCNAGGTDCIVCKTDKCENGKLSVCKFDKSGYETEIACANGCDDNARCQCSSDCSLCNQDGSCGTGSDINGNHMIDFYETSTHQGKSCRVHSDCDTNVGQNDGFCDSFIGYKCSTKCTTDSQCMPSDSSFTYVCRNDGRCAPNTFETVWRINQNNESIVIPLIHAQKCQFKIKWGDNTSIQEVTDCSENLVHKYTHSGDYHVKITGTLYGWHTSSNTNTKDQNADKLIEVVSFGPIGLNGYSGDPNKNQFSFANATNLTKLSQVDIPDASLLTSTKGMFLNAKSFNYPIGNWDTSNVTDMSGTFNNAQSFNQDISRWNTSKVTTMDSMFANAYVFNQKLNTWNTSKVTNMANLFNGAKTFNQDLSNWDTSNVTNMSYMFSSANAFDQDISNWHTSQVTNMLGLFSNAFVFNQNISKWDTSKVTNMSYMFFNAVAFNQDISYWDISKLTNWDQIFCNCGLSDPFKDKIQTNWNKTNNSIKDLLSCN